MRSLGPTESARRSHTSARSRQYCGDISAPIPGNLRTFSGSPNTPLAKSCPKLASAWGCATQWWRYAKVVGDPHDLERRLTDPTGPRVALETFSAIMGTCRPRWAFPGDNAADDLVALMIFP